MAKNLIIGALLVVVAGLAYFLLGRSTPVEVPTTNTTEPKDNEVMCAQVITPARNPDTGEIREFPTPCDVPEGWEEIQNDIPTLDLEVQ